MANLIPPPDLDIRDEEQLAADAIAHVTGSLTIARIDTQIASLRKLRDRLESGLVLTPAICPELTNANPSSPHTVLLEAISWQMAQMAYRINQLPVRDEIAFANLFNIGLRDPAPAATELTFTLAAGLPQNVAEIIVPQGTLIQVAGQVPPLNGPIGPIAFTTDVDLVIPTTDTTGSVSATCTTSGALQLGPNTVTNMVDPVAFVASVTNVDPVDSGSDQETVDEALQRARAYQQRAERLVSAADVEDAILNEALNGEGIVKAFPFVKAADWANANAGGNTTIIVGTVNGNPVDAAAKTAISALLTQAIGSQFFFLLDPQYVTFNIEATLLLTGISGQAAILAGAESALRAFYAAKTGNFGRAILRAEIIAVLEGTSGVKRVVAANPNGPILAAPVSDVTLAPYQLPQLVNVVLHVSS